MALSGEIMKYVGNELMGNAGKELGASALSSLVPKAVADTGVELATKSAIGSVVPKTVAKATLGSILPKTADDGMMTLYRGLTQEYDPKFPVARLDTSGYESWTDNPQLAKQYGDYVYSIDVPKNDIKTSYLDEDPKSLTYGDRNPIYSIEKKAGLNGVDGKEYLLEVGSDYQKGLNYNPVKFDNEVNMAIQNAGVDENAAMRAMGYITNDYGRLADKSGKPVKFYHSTPNEFSEFDNARLGDNTGYSNTALGHFVTEDKDFSSRFRDINNEGNAGTTMELQAKVQNPVIHPYMAGQKYSDPAQLDRIVEDYYKAIGSEDSLNTLREYAAEDGQSLYDEYMDMTLGEDPFESAADERNALMNNGFDAVEIVEGPRNGLVEGATEDTPVSSLAVLDGKNLRRTMNIPVSKADATGVDIDVRRGAKTLPARDMNADGFINWQDVNSVHKQAGEQQKVLDKIGRAIAEKNNFPQYQDFKPKSIESMLNKVKRKGGNYSLASMKDHTRNKIIMNGWQDVPAVLSDLKQMGMNPNVEFVQNEWGYKGLHLTGRFDNGLGWELQLSTPEDWPRKLKSDAIYDKWRNTELDTASPREIMGYMNAMRESKAMWAQSKMPDLSIYDNVTGR